MDEILLRKVMAAGAEIKLGRKKIIYSGADYEVFEAKTIGSSYKLIASYFDLTKALAELIIE
jgi:hypothetical protein